MPKQIYEGESQAEERRAGYHGGEGQAARKDGAAAPAARPAQREAGLQERPGREAQRGAAEGRPQEGDGRVRPAQEEAPGQGAHEGGGREARPPAREDEGADAE